MGEDVKWWVFCSTCADSVLLWAVMEIYGLEAVEQVEVRGGTGGGVFL